MLETLRKYRNQIIVFGSIFILFIGAEFLAPKPVDWTMSFEKDSKIPYGSNAMFELLPGIFPESTIEINTLSVYELFLDKIVDSTANYILINDKFSPDELDAVKLLAFAEAGGSVFISAQDISGFIADTLNVVVDIQWLYFSDTLLCTNLIDSALKTTTGYCFDKVYLSSYFISYDTINTTVLATNQHHTSNYIQIKHGGGYIYMHLNPMAFTNYHVLKNPNSDYAAKVLSFLPNRHVYWDEYYKTNKAQGRTPLRYILKNPPLKTAYILTLVSVLAYMVFESKRTQRTIPVIKPLPNTSLEFIETIGKLYHTAQNHKDIAGKKFNYLLEYLRSRYYIRLSSEDIPLLFSNINTSTGETLKYEQIAEKTGVELQLVHNIFSVYWKIYNSEAISADNLLRFNRMIEDFYNKCK